MMAYTAATASALIYLVPLLWMLAGALLPSDRIFSGGFSGIVDPAHYTLQNFIQVAGRKSFVIGFVNSLLQVAIIIGAGLLVSSTAAYAFARMEFPGREALFALVVVLIILPIEVLVVPLLITVRDLGLTGGRTATLSALTLPFVAKAFNVYFLRQHFLSFPRELEEAARIDGASRARIYFSLALPAIRPALATAALLDVLTHWSDFIWPLMVSTRNGTETIQLELAALFTQPPVAWGEVLAFAVLATLPVMVAFAALGRSITLTDVRTGIRG
jgi:multiple sugar transport system permease protein/fructooligosaccharide transport system permease protein